MPLTQVSPGMLDSTAQYYSFKNRIINGAMVIDQRNAGASVTPSGAGAGTYTLDRWCYQAGQTSRFNVQRNAGSVTPPAGFTNYLGFTVASAVSITSSDYFNAYQAIEGFNAADFAWGTANAQAVTLSFWVRSSLTGTFGGVIKNGTPNRSYPFTYTISAANTWEYKTITIPGDTTGTWATDNSVGLYVLFSLGNGSTFSGTAGAWSGSNLNAPTGATSVVGTNGATFYITGVQLEKGSTATSFDYRPYGTELVLCQRYALSSIPVGAGWGSNKGLAGSIASMSQSTSARVPVFFNFPVQMRATPTITTYNPSSSGSGFRNDSAGTDVGETVSGSALGATGVGVFTASTASAVNQYFAIHISASAEL